MESQYILVNINKKDKCQQKKRFIILNSNSNSMKSQQKRSLNNNNNNQTIEMDPYSTTILDQLIQNQQEWQASDEIVKLTFKAITDVIKIHGQSIKDIKSILTTRASKTQLTTGLSLKANVSDISQTIDEISTQMDQKLSYNDLNKILKDYIPRSEISKIRAQEMQTNKNEKSLSQHQNLNKQTMQNFKIQLQILRGRMDEFQKMIAKQVSNCVNVNQFRQALNIIDTKANEKQIEQKMQLLVSKQFLSQCLQKKINKTDLQPLLDAKADVQDLQYIVSSLESKVNLATLQKLTQVIENKADKSDLMLIVNQRSNMTKSNNRIQIDENAQKIQQLKMELNSQLAHINEKIETILNNSVQQSLINKKINLISNQFHESINLLRLQHSKNFSDIKMQSVQAINSLKSQVKSINQEILYRNTTKNQTFMRELNNEISLRKRCEQKIYDEIDEVRKKIDQFTQKLVDKSEFTFLRNQIIQALQNKIGKEQLVKEMSQLTANLSLKFEKENQENTLLLDKLQKTYAEVISSNTNDILKLNKTLSKKQDKLQFASIEQTVRKTRKQVQQCRKTVDRSYQELQLKLSISEYQNDLIEIKKRFDKIFKEIEIKANIKDVCVLADSKPNIDDVNNALKQINQALNQKIALTELQAILKDQSAINETLCSENIVGRWMWQSGDLKPGSLIPWQIQSANTVPEHFFWQKDKTSILILAPGIYEIKACIFSRNSSISVLINGQTLEMSNNDENSNIMSNLKGKTVSQGKKRSKDKQFCGNNVQYFVMLPARSRVSVSCLGEIAEGFLNIRRY